MLRYSNDVNVYVESKSPMHEKKLPVIAKAAGIYRHPSVARNLENPNSRTITETSLTDEYNEALRLAEVYIVHIYQILGSKGYVTEEEWDLILNSVGRNNYLFPDVVLELGTTMRWQIDSKVMDSFLRTILSKHGIDVRILPMSGGSALYQDETVFLEQMATHFSVNLVFEKIEKKIDSADYGGTKKRLHYMNLYDFLKFHFNMESIPNQQELISLLLNCKDNASANIISAREMIEAIQGDFWKEYEKYREFKMVQVLARWFSKSTVRILNGQAYEYFAETISEQMLLQATKFLKVHTAFMNVRKAKSATNGTSATFSFEIQNCSGDVYATIGEGAYATQFRTGGKKIKLHSKNTLEIEDLEYGKTYCVALWEVLENDAAKIGELPKITPGINWPVAKDFCKIPVDRVLQCKMRVEGGEGNLSYCACIRKGTGKITSPSEGERFNLQVHNGTLTFSSNDLEYDEVYTVCVFALLNNGAYFEELIPSFQYVPKKVELVKIIRKAETSNGIHIEKEANLDFADRQWPSIFGEGIVRFACRTDRYPQSPEDGEILFSIPPIRRSDYLDGVFKITSKKLLPLYSTLYICGWLDRGTGNEQLIVQNCLYDLQYKVKGNVLRFDVMHNLPYEKIEFPEMRICCFDKKDTIVYSEKNAKIGSDYRYTMTPTGKVKYIVIEAADPVERMMYRFRSAKTLDFGKSKI